jgi:osmotically inducible lipoprotein OsmB
MAAIRDQKQFANRGPRRSFYFLDIVDATSGASKPSQLRLHLNRGDNMKIILALASVALLTAACGTTQHDRAISGGLIGAGTGAAIGSLTGNVGAGAVIGGVAGAATGAFTHPSALNI